MQNLNDQDMGTRDSTAFLVAGWMAQTRALYGRTRRMRHPALYTPKIQRWIVSFSIQWRRDPVTSLVYYPSTLIWRALRRSFAWQLPKCLTTLSGRPA